MREPMNWGSLAASLAALEAQVRREGGSSRETTMRREAVRRLYVRTVLAVDALGSDDTPEPGPMQRLVHRLVDGLDEDDAPWLALTAVRRLALGARVVETHSVNVAVLSIAMASAIGLDRAARADIGMAALLHDVGHGRGAKTESHGIDGAAWLVDWAPLDRATLLAAVAAGHPPHNGAAHGGAAPGTVEPDDVATRILRIADAYDVLTGRDGVAGSPDLVLAFLLQGSGNRFDAALLKIFTRVVGIYPPGTTVRLPDGAIGVVVRPTRREDALDRPIVRLVIDARGRAVEQEAIVDLHTAGIDIGESLDPTAHGIDPAALALGR
jgi:hypothetical protein